MKLRRELAEINRLVSHPTRGAWIETDLTNAEQKTMESHPTRGAWIETNLPKLMKLVSGSHPTRGAWIETLMLTVLMVFLLVAPHPGCVD